MSVTQAQMPPVAPSAADGMLDLNALWRAVMAHKFWIIIPTVLALIGSFVVVHLVTPRYTGEARILLENRDSYFTRPSGERETGERFDQEAVLSQVQLITSRDLAREAVRRLGLVGNPEFDSGAGLFGSVFELMVKIGLARHPADRTPADRVLEKYYDALLVYPVARSRVIVIEFQSRDAELAARAANTIAAVYLEQQEAAKKDTVRGASSWLSGAIQPLRQRVLEAEAKVEEFRSRNGLLIGSNNTTITQQQLADISQQLSAARSAQADSQAKARVLRDGLKAGRIFEVPDIANNELVRRLIEQRVSLRAQIALESRTLLPEHPRIKELTAQITDLESQIRAAAERAARTLENEARIAGSRVETLTATIDAQKRLVAEANESEVQLRALEREARTQREQLEQFLARNREATARDAENASPADARVVSRAITPLSPSFPKKTPIIAVSTLATFFVALALVISRELLSGRAVQPAGAQPFIPHSSGGSAPAPGAPSGARFAPASEPRRARTASTDEPPPAIAPEDIQRDTRRARVAGLIAHAGRLTHLRLPTDDAGTWREQVATVIPPASQTKGTRVLLIDAGTRANAAATLARELSEDATAVLVDLTALDGTTGAGLSELMAGDVGFADIIHRDPASRLHVIGAGHAGREAVLAARDVLDVALDALADAYDLVLVEGASRDVHRFAAEFRAQADGVLVLADNHANGHAVETAYKMAEGNDLPVAIVVFEDAVNVIIARERQQVEV